VILNKEKGELKEGENWNVAWVGKTKGEGEKLEKNGGLGD